MPAAIGPGSSMPSCHSEPESRGTWRAMPTFVPRPIFAPDSASCERRRTSPRQCVGYAPDSRDWRQLHGPKDCRTLYPGTGVAVPPRWAAVVRPRWRRGSPPTIWHHGRWLPRPRCSKGRLVRPQGYSACSQPCRGPSDCVQSGPPQTSFAHRSICRLPFPIYVAQLFAPLYQDCPHSAQHTQFRPALQGAMDGAVVSKFFGQSIPLAPTTQAKDDAIEHQPRISAFAAPGIRRVFLKDDGLNAFPKLVRHFPDGI